jgi:eukaryotic-like serine/threonine-protein kinase
VLLGRVLADVGDVPRAVEVLRQAQRRHPHEFWVNQELAIKLRTLDPPRYDQAVGFYRAALAVRPDSPGAHQNLATVLDKTGEPGEAEAEYREAIRLQPDFTLARANLSQLLVRLNRFPEAERECREAIRLQPQDARTHAALGFARLRQSKLPEAEAELREAIRLRPEHGVTHDHLGTALFEQGRLAEAEAEHREAIRLNPDWASAHHNLSVVLNRWGKLTEAEAACREALRLKPDFAEAHSILANIRIQQNRWDEAEAACQTALRLNPDVGDTHYNYGLIHSHRGRWAEAEAAYREAVRLRPGYAIARYNLGRVLDRNGKPGEAEAAYREVIRLQPDLAEAHCNLGQLLVRAGRFADAAPALGRGHELGSKRPNWPYPSGQWLRDCERMAVLDARLPAVLAGDEQPAGAAEAVEFARLCQLPCKQLNAAALRFYTAAFAADPKLADDLKAAHRYNAACAAALVAAGQGRDARQLPDGQRACLRRRALEWLRADLKALAERLEGGQSADQTAVQNTLRHWQHDSDLASLRDAAAVDGLSADERDACQKFWADVEALLAKAKRAP